MLATNDKYSAVRYVLKAAAIATLVLGLTLLFFSAEIIRLFAKEWSQERHFAIYLGTALVGVSVTNWLYSQSRSLEAMRPAIIGNLVSLATASVIDVVFVFEQPGSVVIWLILLLHIAFAGAFTYCLFNTRRLSKI